MSYNLTQQELNEMHDWSAKAEQLVRLGMMPVAKLPYIKRALKLVAQDAFLPLIIRKPFYEFIEELLELGLGEAGIYRLIRNKVAANRNDSVSNRYMPEEIAMEEKVQINEYSKKVLGRYVKKAQTSLDTIWDRLEKEPDVKKAQPDVDKFAKRIRGRNAAREKLKEEVGTVPPQPRWLKGNKLTRPNFYKDEKHKENDTETQKIADKAHSTMKVTEAKGDAPETDKEMYKKIDRPKYNRNSVEKAINASRQPIGKKERSLIHRLLKGRHGVSEETIGTVPQQPRWLKGKKLFRSNPYDDKTLATNKTQTGELVNTLSQDVQIHEGNKENKEKKNALTKKVGHRAYFDYDGVSSTPSARELKKLGRGFLKTGSTRGVNWSAEHSHKVTESEEKGGWYDRGLPGPENKSKLTKKQSVQAKKDFIAAAWKKRGVEVVPKSTTEGFGNFVRNVNAVKTKLADVGKGRSTPTPHAPRTVPLGSRTGGPKSPQNFKMASKEHVREARATDDPMIKRATDLWKRTNPTNKISAIAKAHRDFDGRVEPKTSKPMPSGKAVQLKLNMSMDAIGNILDEDVNYRTTPQGMLQTMANMVRIKKRHAGKISVNDRKVASKARNELRRRKYFGNVNASFEPTYLDLADVLAEEGVFLDDMQLDELKKLGPYIKAASADLNKRDEEESNKSFQKGHAKTGLKYDRDDIDPDKARKLDNREKGIERAKKIVAKESYVADHPEEKGWEPEGAAPVRVKRVKPSKASWYKNSSDAVDTSDVDTKKKITLKNSYQVRFTQALEKFGVQSISELDEEKTKEFLRFVDTQTESTLSYAEIQAQKKKAPEKETEAQKAYKAEKEKRAGKVDPDTENILAKTKETIDADRKSSTIKKIRRGE